VRGIEGEGGQRCEGDEAMRLRVLGFLLMVAVALCSAPCVSSAQQEGKVWRIGYLGGGAPATAPSDAFVQELRRLGWSEGQNLTIEYRWAEGGADRLYDLGREMVSLNMDVIVVNASSSGATLVVPTRTIPVVISTFDRPLGPSGTARSDHSET